MALSHFLAMAISLYYLVVGIALIVNRQRFVGIYSEMMNNPTFSVFAGIIALIIGTLIILSHNVWVWGWPVLVTIVGWASFFKGVMLLIFPDRFSSWFVALFRADRILIMGCVLIALSALFGYFGFFT